MRGTNYAQHRKPLGHALDPGVLVELQHTPENPVGDESGFLVLHDVFTRGWICKEQAPHLHRAMLVGAVFRRFHCVHVNPDHVMAADGVTVGGVKMVQHERKVRGAVLCAAGQQHAVREALGALLCA